MMSTLGIIPIRKQSSRFRNKTWAFCNNEMLIDITLDLVNKSDCNLDGCVVLSACSDVKRHCVSRDIPYVERPSNLEFSSIHVLNTINWFISDVPGYGRYDNHMLLQITNPTRTVRDINQTIELLKDESINSVCSVVNVGEFHPSRMYYGGIGDRLKPIEPNHQWVNTQSLPKRYLRDGSIYAWRVDAFLRFGGHTLLPQSIKGVAINQERSIRIDYPDDLVRAESYLTRSR